MFFPISHVLFSVHVKLAEKAILDKIALTIYKKIFKKFIKIRYLLKNYLFN